MKLEHKNGLLLGYNQARLSIIEFFLHFTMAIAN